MRERAKEREQKRERPDFYLACATATPPVQPGRCERQHCSLGVSPSDTCGLLAGEGEGAARSPLFRPPRLFYDYC